MKKKCVGWNLAIFAIKKMKTALITGATGGIGLATAIALAKLGYTVLIVGRDENKVTQAVLSIKKQSLNSNIIGFTTNLANTFTIKNLAEDVLKIHSTLDILVNNAGAYFSTQNKNACGLEITMATNHVPYVYLTHLLLPALMRAPSARVINVASQAQMYGKFNSNDLFNLQKYSPIKAYGNSKLYNIMFTFWLANELKNTNITVNAMHPGGVNTGFAKNATGLTGFIFRNLKFMLRSAQKGAETIIWLATSNSVNGVSGKYFYDKKEIKAQPVAYNVNYQKQLINETFVYIEKCIKHTQLPGLSTY
jgi:NAD(P)-dependent dehydrogenase (short-subunit alcohol dehydrogenase family)